MSFISQLAPRLLVLTTMTAMSVSASDPAVFIPDRVSYARLASPGSPTSQVLMDTLSSDGIVSVTDIPGFGDIKRNLLRHLHACLMDQEEDGEKNDSKVSKNLLIDGTVRRTISSSTIPGPGGARPFFDHDDILSPNCEYFSKGLRSFRKMVDEVTEVFADRLSSEMGTSLKSPLMYTADGDYSFDELKDVVRNGEHLEHFHSYQKPSSSQGSDISSQETIALHTDQGLFIALTPGLMVTNSAAGDNGATNMKESEGFYIQTAEGTRALVEFSPVDDLVFMMGDGVNQYVNPMLRGNEKDLFTSPGSVPKKLRATPHAVSLPPMDGNTVARVWYGLMVLPPSSALNEKEGRTYGEIRHLMSHHKNEHGVSASLGCSSIDHRFLAADSSNGGESDGCEEGSSKCWFRCMSHMDFEVSHESCSLVSDDHAVKCVNPRQQVSDGFKHGDYFLSCTDSVANITDYPKLPYYPRDESCSMEKWEQFNSKDDDTYDFVFDLTKDNTTTPTMLHWSVTDVEAGTVKGRLSFNGIFGWLALGFLNNDPNAGHNGMNGANIVMAVPGSEYDAMTGLDLTEDTTVAEYKINPYGSSFRHWQDAVGETNTLVVEHECFTALEFEMTGINGEQFDVGGFNTMLWGGNKDDAFVGYHSRGNRGIFTVEWATGRANFGKELLEVVEESEESEDATASAASYWMNNAKLSNVITTIAVVVAAIIAT